MNVKQYVADLTLRQSLIFSSGVDSYWLCPQTFNPPCTIDPLIFAHFSWPSCLQGNAIWQPEVLGLAISAQILGRKQILQHDIEGHQQKKNAENLSLMN